MSLNDSVKNESLPVAVWMLFIATITAMMGLGLVGPVLPTISKQLAASPSQVTLLYTSYNAVMAVAMLFTGFISTRLSIKKTLMLGIGIIGIFAFLAGFANNIWTIVGLRGLWGIGNSLFFATGLTALILLAGSAKARSIILFEAAFGIGISVGPLIGGLLGQFSWRFSFFGVGVIMAVVFALLLIYVPNVKEEVVKGKENTSLLDPFRAMKHRSIAVLGTSNFLYNFGFFALVAYAPLALGLSPLTMGGIFLVWGVLLALTSYFIGPKLIDRYGSTKPLYLILTLFMIVLLVMGIWTNMTWLMIACIIFSGALFGSINPLFSNAVMDASPVESSTTSAAFNFLRLAGGAIAPFMAGLLAELFSPHVPFLVGGCFVLGSIILIVLNRHHIQPVKSKIVEEKPKETILKVKDFMISDVISIKPNVTVRELLKLLTKHHIGGVPVVNNQNKLIGMISDGDIMRYLAPKEGSVHDFIYGVLMEEGETEQEVLKEKINTTVDKLMHKKRIYTLKKEDTLEKTIQILSQHHFKKLPVLDLEGKVTGIISRGDVNNNLMKILSQK
ncbi:MFS transporter [uncultured Methanobacterium sp.]|uniref:MFS transporter n=1 Tax=uncultured Methanobacterium sp. TaxID=176306 RepID=UPI002AA7B421|nr:MFS transporter [uncultured Methanobacterium sp.]